MGTGTSSLQAEPLWDGKNFIKKNQRVREEKVCNAAFSGLYGCSSISQAREREKHPPSGSFHPRIALPRQIMPPTG